MNKIRNFVSGKYLLFFFLVFLGVGVIYFFGSYLLESSPKIKDLKLTNISDTSVTVTYYTDTPSNESVIVSDSDNFNILSGVVKVKYFDDRNDGVLRTSHHITINGLKAESVYYLRVMGNLKEVPYTYPTIVTGRTLDSLRTPDPTYGRYILPELKSTNLKEFADALVFLDLNSGSAQSSLINAQGGFTFDKANVRTSDLSTNVSYKSGDQLTVRYISKDRNIPVSVIVGEDQPMRINEVKASSLPNSFINPLNSSLIGTVSAERTTCGDKAINSHFCNDGLDYVCDANQDGPNTAGWKHVGTCTSTPTPAPSQESNAGSGTINREAQGQQVASLTCGAGTIPNGYYCNTNDGYAYNCSGSTSKNGTITPLNTRCTDNSSGQTQANTGSNSGSGTNASGNANNSGFSDCKDKGQGYWCNNDNSMLLYCDGNGSGNVSSSCNGKGCKSNPNPKADECNTTTFTSFLPSINRSPLPPCDEQKLYCDPSLENGIKCNGEFGESSCCPPGKSALPLSRTCSDYVQKQPECKINGLTGSRNQIPNSSLCYDKSNLPYYECSTDYSFNKVSEKCEYTINVHNLVGLSVKLTTCDPTKPVSEDLKGDHVKECLQDGVVKYYCEDTYQNSGNKCVLVNLNNLPLCEDVGPNCVGNASDDDLGDLVKCRADNSQQPISYCCRGDTGQRADQKCLKTTLNNKILNEVYSQSVLGVSDGNKATIVNVNEEGVYKIDSVTGYTVSTSEIKVTKNADGTAEIKFFADKNGNGLKDLGEDFITTPLEVKLDKQKDLSSYSLKLGWNLISWSMVDNKIKTGMDFLNEIANSGGYATHIATYRNGGWVLLSQRAGQKFGKDFDLIPNEGYFVKVLKAVDLNIEGTKISKDQDMFFSTGWNLIGYRSDIKSAKSFIDEVNKNTSLEMDTVTRFENSRYENLVKDTGTFYGNDFNIIEDKGYFVRLKKAGVVWKR